MGNESRGLGVLGGCPRGDGRAGPAGAEERWREAAGESRVVQNTEGTVSQGGAGVGVEQARFRGLRLFTRKSSVLRSERVLNPHSGSVRGAGPRTQSVRAGGELQRPLFEPVRLIGVN